ncbi:hypothetical protein [Herbaspirillum huttiense]
MRNLIGWLTALAISASPCAWDTHESASAGPPVAAALAHALATR